MIEVFWIIYSDIILHCRFNHSGINDGSNQNTEEEPRPAELAPDPAAAEGVPDHTHLGAADPATEGVPDQTH